MSDRLIWILCTFDKLFVSFVSPVGSIWRPCCANWASVRQSFALRWQRGRAHSSWPTPSTSSSLRFASASLWCRCLSSCATSERLVSLNRPHPHPDDPSPLLRCLMKQQTSWLLMAIIRNACTYHLLICLHLEKKKASSLLLWIQVKNVSGVSFHL